MKKFFIFIACIFFVACDDTVNSNVDSTNSDATGEAVVLKNILNEPEKFKPYYTVSATHNRYRGNWFDIDVPAGFIARPTDAIVPEESVYNTDEAYFTAPDGNIELYVYSPQWSGDTDYVTIAPNEVLVDTTSKEEQEDIGLTRTAWTTVKAKDNSYMRSFVSIRSQIDTGSEVHHVFGIRYTSQADYDKFKAEYEAFKKSLVQYAD